MSDRINYNQCPGCKSINILEIFEAEDFTVSHEFFPIYQCNYCTLRFTQNVPPENEIAKYYQSQNYVSHTDTNKGFVNRLYHIARGYTLKSKKNLIENASNLQSGNLLDIGAGTGAFANAMMQAGWDVTGLEPNETARKTALEKYNITLQELIFLSSIEENHFDVITMWHVLEHVHALHDYLNNFQRILKPGGLLFIAVPNYTSLESKYYKQNWAAYDVPRHLYHFSPSSMEELMRQHQFEIKNTKPMWFDSFYVSMLSEKNISGKNHFIKAMWNGFESNLKALADVKKCSSIIYVIKKSI